MDTYLLMVPRDTVVPQSTREALQSNSKRFVPTMGVRTRKGSRPFENSVSNILGITPLIIWAVRPSERGRLQPYFGGT